MLTRRTLLLSLPPLALAGCGFELRRTPQLPFSRLALQGFTPRSPLLEELRRTLAPTVQVVEDVAQAEAVLQAVLDRREKSVNASTAAGQVRGVQLRVRFDFRLTSPAGRELIGETALQLARDMTYSETFALAKEQEEAQLYQAMQSDIVLQLMRRIAQLKKPAG
ncbi:LPS assembly lipoprotein LptE [Aquabacterium sp.]|uniref:LPS-assembly lipoprotein LptE n=1 Tax=Aquabacterium sp. TaxID=1872578 RepID=UPI002BCC0BEC|nr:LPS assembly lipoprotein LptE [Aquabacterium sp.]HSW03152.1 LPS assembly lipoprotein LptE [Aquabacterium sp.]